MHLQTDQRNITQLVDDFLSELGEKTGVTGGYLKTARPAIRQMFENTQPELIESAKKNFVNRAMLHAQTQHHLKKTLQHLESLSIKSTDQTIEGDDLERVNFTKAVVVNTLIKTYGGFGRQERTYS